jgi:hypothetical protein
MAKEARALKRKESIVAKCCEAFGKYREKQMNRREIRGQADTSRTGVRLCLLSR